MAEVHRQHAKRRARRRGCRIGTALLALLLPSFARAQVTDQELRQWLLAQRPGDPTVSADLPPWPEWDPTTVSCSSFTPPIPLDVIPECGAEALKFVLEWVEIARAQTPGERGWEAVDAAFATAGLPLSAVKCVIRGIAVHSARQAHASEAEIAALRQRIDTIADVAGLLQTARDLMGSAWTKGIGRTLLSPEGAAGAWDASKAGGLPAEIGRALTLHEGRLDGFDAAITAAEAAAGSCRPADAEARARATWQEARGYVEELRENVVHYEQLAFCGARSTPFGATPAEKVWWSGGKAVLDTANTYERNGAERFARIAAGMTQIQRRAKESADRRREFLADLAGRDGAIGAALATCDVSDLAVQRTRLDSLSQDPCAEATGEGATIAAKSARIDAALAALAEARHIAPAAVAPVRAALGACRPDVAETELARARGELTRIVAASELRLTSCAELQPWPTTTMEDAISDMRARLDDARREGRRLLGEARTATQSCQFARATELLGQVGADLASCPIDPANCEAGPTADRAACLATRLLQDRQAADEAAVAREAAYHAASAETAATGEQLWAWGQEQLAAARAADASRCAAVQQIPSIARDLEGLANPIDCPDARIQTYRDRGAALRARVAEIERELVTRRESLVAAGRRAVTECKTDELEAVLAKLDRLTPQLCGTAVPERAELEEGRTRLATLVSDAATILTEAEGNLAAWIERCDPEPLRHTEAGLSNLERCGWDRLDASSQARVRALVDWGRQADHLVGIVERARAVGRPLLAADTYVGAALQRSAMGTDAQGRAAFSLERDRAAAALADANGQLADIEADPWSSPACLTDIGRRRAAVAARIAALEPPTVVDPGAAGDWGNRPSRADEADPCAGPRPEYQAALRALVAAAEQQDVAAIEAAAARLHADCPRDVEQLEALRARFVALAEAKADANERRMRSALSHGRARRDEEAAAWASLAGAAQAILAQQQRAVGSGVGGGAAPETTAKDGGDRATPTCMVVPYREQPGTGGGEYRYFVFESAGGAGIRAFQILKAARKEGGGLGGGASMRGPFGSLATARGELDRLCPPSQRATASLP